MILNELTSLGPELPAGTVHASETAALDSNSTLIHLLTQNLMSLWVSG